VIRTKLELPGQCIPKLELGNKRNTHTMITGKATTQSALCLDIMALPLETQTVWQDFDCFASNQLQYFLEPIYKSRI